MAKRHLCPPDLEEKIVGYSDKCIDDGKVVPIEVEIHRLQGDGKAAAAERVRKLHDELVSLLGKEP